MTDNDRDRFAELMTGALGFYGQTVTDFALDVWWRACQGFELEQVSQALSNHVMDPDGGKWAPKPADLVRLLQGTSVDRSLLAWSKVLEAMQRVGAYQSVAFDDPAIHCTIEDLGGWVKVARSSYDDLPHVQRRFCEAHKTYSKRPDLAHIAYLPGASEADNRTAGRAVAPPMLIGDPERALAVIRGGSAATAPRITVTPAALALQHLAPRRELAA